MDLAILLQAVDDPLPPFNAEHGSFSLMGMNRPVPGDGPIWPCRIKNTGKKKKQQQKDVVSNTVTNNIGLIHWEDKIEGMKDKCLLADRGYDSNEIVENAAAGMQVVILPRKYRKKQLSYDKHLYELRHRIENAFLHLKRWRG
jgi:hypothetical protein